MQAKFQGLSCGWFQSDVAQPVTTRVPLSRDSLGATTSSADEQQVLMTAAKVLQQHWFHTGQVGMLQTTTWGINIYAGCEKMQIELFSGGCRSVNLLDVKLHFHSMQWPNYCKVRISLSWGHHVHHVCFQICVPWKGESASFVTVWVVVYFRSGGAVCVFVLKASFEATPRRQNLLRWSEWQRGDGLMLFGFTCFPV